MYFIFYDYIYIMWIFMLRKNNDNSDNPIIYVGYLFLGLFLLAILL